MTDARDEAGFTLIELLVSLAITAMVAGLLLGGIGNAAALARRSQSGERDLLQVAVAQTQLRDRLAALRPHRRYDRPKPTADFRGLEHAVDFYALGAQARRGEGLRKFRLLLTAPGDLVLFDAGDMTDNLQLDEPSVVGWQATPLLDKVASLSIGYYGATATDPQRKWRIYWSGASSPPELVRIRVGFAAGDTRRWPDLVVRPGATVDLACDPEASRQRCGAGART